MNPTKRKEGDLFSYTEIVGEVPKKPKGQGRKSNRRVIIDERSILFSENEKGLEEVNNILDKDERGWTLANAKDFMDKDKRAPALLPGVQKIVELLDNFLAPFSQSTLHLLH